jgi:excisionase family DNA binding protein
LQKSTFTNGALTVHEIPPFVFDRAAAPQPLFTADEVKTWPLGLLEDLVQQGVVKPTDNAQAVTCDACSHDHVEPVTYLSNGPDGEIRAFIACPEVGRVRVDLNRLRQWAVDVETLKSLTGWTPPQPEQDADAIKMTIAEVARYVGVRDRTIREWRENGKIRVVEDKHGHLIFSKSSLQILRESRRLRR